MKKIALVLILGICLNACSLIDSNSNTDVRYFSMIELIEERDQFLKKSNYFDINIEMSHIDGGFRYYVIVDNARSALYDIEAIAIEKGQDYSKTMAASVGIFEETEYIMIPNQSKPDEGYVAGLSFSGTTSNQNTEIYVLVQWKSKDHTETYREFFCLEAAYQGVIA